MLFYSISNTSRTISPEEICKLDIFTECIKAKLGDSLRLLPDCDPKHPIFVPYKGDEKVTRNIAKNDIYPINCSLTNTLINSEVLLN